MNEEALFDQLLTMPASSRAAFLEKACAGEPQQRQRLEVLLHAHEHPGSFLQAPLSAQVATVDEPMTERPGTVIGPYKLMEQIGEGGMGLVFVAEQQQPIRRRVALKVIKPGMDTRQVIARFEAERQALALMDHPNIAKVLDAGTTSEVRDQKSEVRDQKSQVRDQKSEVSAGRPYFVMELVRGVAITEYCDANRLTLRERLELFVPVCQAVQHAHQKGIIHRDLKPSNVLVTLHDGVPAAKVIDFGVAKAIGQQLTDKSIYTCFTQMIGTPLYMSPEQAEMSGLDVDTRSDIYSLGVLLYELLTGTTPFDRERFREVGYDEMRRIIREEEPPKPSTRISTLGEGATLVSTQRKSDPKRLRQLLRGELDWIVMKALEKDRNRRYETASGLARDVQRYLNDEPVSAGPPSAAYRLRKFARRHKAALSVAGLVLFFIVSLGIGVGWVVRDRQAREAEIAHDREVREAALESEVNRALNEARPLMEQEKWPEALAAVERAGKLLASTGRTERPPRLVDLQKELTMAQRLDDIYRGPERDFKADVAILGLAGSDHGTKPQQVSAEEEFFWGRGQDAQFAEAFQEFGIDIEAHEPAEAAARIARTNIRQALLRGLDDWAAMRQRARGDTDPLWKKLVEIARQADSDEWRKRFREALLRRDRRALEKLADGVPIRQVPPATPYLLGQALWRLGALDKAMAVLREAHRHHPDDFWLNDALGWLNKDGIRPSRYEDALRYYMATVVLRPRNPNTHHAVAVVLSAKKQLDEAIHEYRTAIDLDPKFAPAHGNLGKVLREKGQLDEAIREFRTVIELDPKSAQPHISLGAIFCDAKHDYDQALACFHTAIALDPMSAAAHMNLGNALSHKEKLNEAIREFRTAIELDPKFALAHYNLAVALRTNKQLDEAIREFRTGIELDPKWVPGHGRLGDALLAKGHLDEAIREFRAAIALDPRLAWVHSQLGAALRHKGQLDEGIREFRIAIDLDPKRAPAHTNLGAALHDKGQLDEAIREFRTAIGLDPKRAPAHNNLGIALSDKKQLDEAIHEFRRAIDLDPKWVPAYDSLGNALRDKGQLDEAIHEFCRAIDLDPKWAPAHNSLGIALYAKKHLDEAIHEYRTAIELDPKFAPAHGNLGNALRDKGQLDEAIHEYRIAIDLDPKLAPAHNSLGNALSDKKQLDEAIHEFRRAIKLEPNRNLYRANLAIALNKLAWDLATSRDAKGLDAVRAVKLAKEAVDLAPEQARYWNTLGVAHEELQQYEKAFADFNKAIELDAKYAAAYDHLAWILCIWPDRTRWKPGRAIELAKKAVELAPNGDHWNTLGAAHYRAGDWKAAITALEKSIKLRKGGDSNDWFFLAMAHWKLDERGKARQWYDKAVEWMEKNQPNNEELRRFRAEAGELLGVKEKK
jgi:tetratricopeptide (TPR) repeat protein/serine/threonine protein kinase